MKEKHSYCIDLSVTLQYDTSGFLMNRMLEQYDFMVN